jgi:hypothetical protein
MFALLAVVGVASGQSFVALGMAAAPIVSLVVVPWALRRHARARSVGDGEGEFTLAKGGGFAAAVLVIMVAEQTFLNAGPLLLKATTDSNGAALAGFAFDVLLVAWTWDDRILELEVVYLAGALVLCALLYGLYRSEA